MSKGAGLNAAPPDDSSPTPPGWPAPCSATTSSAGPSSSAAPATATSSPSPAPSAPAIPLPGRLVNRSGRPTLRLPRDWPWAQAFTLTLARVRNLHLVTWPAPRPGATADDHHTPTTPTSPKRPAQRARHFPACPTPARQQPTTQRPAPKANRWTEA